MRKKVFASEKILRTDSRLKIVDIPSLRDH